MRHHVSALGDVLLRREPSSIRPPSRTPILATFVNKGHGVVDRVLQHRRAQVEGVDLDFQFQRRRFTVSRYNPQRGAVDPRVGVIGDVHRDPELPAPLDVHRLELRRVAQFPLRHVVHGGRVFLRRPGLDSQEPVVVHQQHGHRRRWAGGRAGVVFLDHAHIHRVLGPLSAVAAERFDLDAHRLERLRGRHDERRRLVLPLTAEQPDVRGLLAHLRQRTIAQDQVVRHRRLHYVDRVVRAVADSREDGCRDEDSQGQLAEDPHDNLLLSSNPEQNGATHACTGYCGLPPPGKAP